MRLRVNDLSEVTWLITEAAGEGEHNVPDLQPESLFRMDRATGLLSVPDVPRGVPDSLHCFGAKGEKVHPSTYMLQDKWAPTPHAF